MPRRRAPGLVLALGVLPVTAAVAIPSADLEASGQWRQGFAIGDLNGDGHLDVAHGPPRAGDGQPRVFLNDGRSGFRPWRDLRFPELPFDYGDVAAADFDGDGRTDLAFGVHLRGIGMVLGDGSGAFRAAPGGPDWTGEGRFATVAIEAVDWDGDGRVDLAALGEGPRPGGEPAYGFRILRNLGNGWARVEGEDPGGLFGDGLSIGDFDGDGQPDAAAASRSLSHRGQVFLGRGADGWDLTPAPLRRGAYVFAIVACDVDGDRHDELLAGFLEPHGAGWRSGIDRLDLDSDGQWSRRIVVERSGDDAPRALACGDLDGDGTLDLIAGAATGRLTLFAGKAGGRFARARKLPADSLAAGCGTRHLNAVDLDGDGRAEVVASFAAEPGADCRTGGALRVFGGRPSVLAD